MAYALVGLAVLVLALAVAVASLQRRVRDLADRLDGLAPAALAPIPPQSVEPHPAPRPVGMAGSAPPSGQPVEPHPLTITDLGGTDPEPGPVRRVSFGTPMIKLAAFSYGVRRALGEDTRTLAAVTMRRELKRQRRQHRRGRRRDAATSSPAQTHGWIS
jgi:hypothetical protein